MTIASANASETSIILKEAIESFNPGHLSHANKRKVPENKLVEHLKTELLKHPNVQVAKHFAHQYKKFDGITFLYQPGVDLFVKHNRFLHGIEVKLPTQTNNFVFYRGIDEALAQSTYGVDFSWIVHFYPMNYENGQSYQKWMEYTIKNSKCPSIGYIFATTKGCELSVSPTRPFSRTLQTNKDINKAIAQIRKDLIQKLNNS